MILKEQMEAIGHEEKRRGRRADCPVVNPWNIM